MRNGLKFSTEMLIKIMNGTLTHNSWFKNRSVRISD